jgi:hypothetical protein
VRHFCLPREGSRSKELLRHSLLHHLLFEELHLLVQGSTTEKINIRKRTFYLGGSFGYDPLVPPGMTSVNVIATCTDVTVSVP